MRKQKSTASAETLSPEYSLDSFVVRPSNALALETAKAIIKEPGIKHNPFFIYGEHDAGKTHLLRAIGSAISNRHHGARVLYTTSKQFNKKMSGDKTGSFYQECLGLDCLLMDDVHFLNALGQEQFLRVMTCFIETHKQIVASADRQVMELFHFSPLRARLIDRLQWGMIADVRSGGSKAKTPTSRKKGRQP